MRVLRAAFEDAVAGRGRLVLLAGEPGMGKTRTAEEMVAEIVPPQRGHADTLSDARLADAVRHGWLRPPLLQGAGAPPRATVAKLADLLRELESDRGDR